MKKIFLLFCLFAVISCGGDDSPQEPITGGNNLSEVKNLQIIDLTQNSVSFSWEAPTDSENVSYYEVYLDAELQESITDLTHTFENLSSNTAYTFKIIPVDLEDIKGKGREITFTTLEGSGPISDKMTNLTYPLNNESCNEGVTNADDASKSDITFEWEFSADAISYELVLNDVTNKTIQSYTSTEKSLDATIYKGATYSWYIITSYTSQDNTGATTTSTEISDTHYFYSLGEAIESYVPYPSRLTSPENSSVLKNKETVQLSWSGSHPDGEIVSYEVYYGTSTVPELYETTSSQTLTVSLESNKTYYWSIVAIDANGNSSTSQLFGFISE